MKIITNIYSDNFEIDNSKVGIELSKLVNNLKYLLDQQEDYGYYLLAHEEALSPKKSHHISLKKLRKLINFDFLMNHIKLDKDLALEYGEMFATDTARLIDIHKLYREIEIHYYCAINLVRMQKNGYSDNQLFRSYNEEMLKQTILFNNPSCGIYLISDERIKSNCVNMIQNYFELRETKNNVENEIQTYKRLIEKLISKKGIKQLDELIAYRDKLKEVFDIINEDYCKKIQ